MRWTAHYSDGSTSDAGIGEHIDRMDLVAISCEGHRVEVPSGAVFHRLERVSVGAREWRFGIIGVDELVTIVAPGGSYSERDGWGTDVLTGPPAGVSHANTV